MGFDPLDESDVVTRRGGLAGCADELMSTPLAEVQVEYARELEMIGHAVGAWLEHDFIVPRLMNPADRVEPGHVPAARGDPNGPLLPPGRRGQASSQPCGGDADHRPIHLAIQAVVGTVRGGARRWSGGWELFVLGSDDLPTQSPMFRPWRGICCTPGLRERTSRA